MLEILILASERPEVFYKIYPELFPASLRVQLQAIAVSTFSIQLGYNTRSDRKNVFFSLFSIRSETAVVFDPVG